MTVTELGIATMDKELEIIAAGLSESEKVDLAKIYLRWSCQLLESVQLQAYLQPLPLPERVALQAVQN